MSVASSRVNSVSSILRSNGIASQVRPNRVYFKLPNDIKNILDHYHTSKAQKEYKKLVYLLQEDAVRDTDLIQFFNEIRQCISILDTSFHSFVRVLLKIRWIDKSQEVISTYKFFLEDLVCMQVSHIKIVIEHLVELLKPAQDNNIATDEEYYAHNDEYKVGEFKEEDINRLNHVHDILKNILLVIPMSSKILMQCLMSQYPYILHGTYTHELYIHAMLEIGSYMPQLRSDILSLIINRLTILDVNIPREKDDDNEEDDLMDDSIEVDNDNPATMNNDTNKTKSVHPMAMTMDACMELLFKYMHEFCFENNYLQIESMRILYSDILEAFNKEIFPTHASRYVQYIIFYISSFEPTITEQFLQCLWMRVINRNEAPVNRQSAVCYISSLVATASYITPSLLKLTMYKLSRWIHTYITEQELSASTTDNPKAHSVFYSVCQAFFHLFIARHKEFVSTKCGIMFLQRFDIPMIIACKLNPLKVCDSEIVKNLADITRTYQLAYCYTVIENNKRNQLPVFGKNFQKKINSLTFISNFFPFESYMLQHSGKRIALLSYDKCNKH